MEKRDEELILELQCGNEEAFRMLYDRYKMPVLNFCLRILGNRADAEDVTAEFFVTLFSKCNMYRPTGKFSTWAFTIARNSCFSRLRKRKRMISLWFVKDNSDDLQEWEIPDPQSLTPEKLIQQEAAVAVRQAISQLPASQKEALVLREYHGMSYDEIAQVMGCSLDNVKVLIFRARERLKIDLPSLIKEDRNG